MQNNLRARVLVRREESESGKPWWVAQVLEYDLAAQGETIDDLVYELQRTLMAHIVCCQREQLEPFACLPPAPESYHQEFRKSRGLEVEITRFSASPVREQDREILRSSFMQQPTLEYRLSASA